jgi:hypothetical protein
MNSQSTNHSSFLLTPTEAFALFTDDIDTWCGGHIPSVVKSKAGIPKPQRRNHRTDENGVITI